jgi:hypothetical protein
MVKNTTINLEVIYKTAVALGELKERVVYVGARLYQDVGGNFQSTPTSNENEI